MMKRDNENQKMEPKLSVLCILIVYSLQMVCVPVQSICELAECGEQGDCVDGKCVCHEGFGGPGCSGACDGECPACVIVQTCTACSPVCNDMREICTTVDDGIANPARTVVVRCTCRAGFTGITDCDKCADDLGCHNAGACEAGICTCDLTHTGTYCERVKQCGSTTCDDVGSDGTCDTGAGANQCKCNPGYITEDCSRLEKCGDHTCHLTGSDGTCTDDKCTCIEGYTGDDCSTLQCGSTTCDDVGSDGTCDTGAGANQCNCRPGYITEDCSRLEKCGTTTCYIPGSDGTCDTGAGANQCKCRPGYITEDCSRLEKCGDHTCHLTGSDGTCTADKCTCIEGYTGDDCSTRVCGTIDCDATGTSGCIGNTCDCKPGYTGDDCSRLENCGSNICHFTGGTGECTEDDICVCNTGYVGDNCSTLKCGTSDCDATGTEKCESINECKCNTGYSGDVCSTLTCGSNVCDVTGGTGLCDPTDDTKCQCKPGYTGDTCASLVTCGDNTCDLTGGTGACAADITKCECKAGFSGDDCSVVTCGTPNPCQNGGSCNSGECDCTANNAGIICQHTCPACDEGKVCTENADKTGAECADDNGASFVLATWTVLMFGVLFAVNFC